ncbi:HAMP domain-containing sensor histidine kinase [Candidatus Tisiphia endosymbiont of Ditula angustiorana]|uniref:sensor histidine kinase n=1 Tax=Candidatus Tisiphia endosymbiont of Ditula angustiorana TaxID=3066272 RepID=UPI00312CA0C5
MIQNKYIVRLSSIGLFINIIVNMIYYRYFIIEEMILKQVGETNIKIADVYTKNVWDRNRTAVDKIHEFGYINLLQDTDFIRFATTSVDIFVNLNAYISLYDLQGNKIITSSPIQVTSHMNFPEDTLYQKILTKIDRYFLKELSIEQAFNKAFKGITTHLLIPRAMLHISGEVKKASCITSYIPIINRDPLNHPVDGVLEIHTNITGLWSSIIELERKVLLTFVIILVIFLVIVMSNTNYAQKIIDRQFEANKALEEAVTKVRNESSAHTKFFANVSHELRTPLNAIIGFSEIMMSTPYNKEHDIYVKDIHNAGKHLLGIITDILDLSKASADKLLVDFVELDLNKLITSTIRIMKPRADQVNVALIEKLPKDHIIIKADPKRLKQVFFNLLSNSIKFTNPLGSITIHAEKNESQGLVYVQVIDTGIGIDEKDIPKVLSTFGQIDSAVGRKYQGTGLGLPLTRKLVELMKGKFDLQSKIGIGTTVTLTFAYDSSIEQ